MIMIRRPIEAGLDELRLSDGTPVPDRALRPPGYTAPALQMSLWEQAHSSESKSRTMEWLDQAAQPPTSPPEPPMVQVEDHVREATNAARSVFAIACRQLRPAARALLDLSH